MVDFPNPLDEQFPVGDGLADGEAAVTCPHCGAVNVVALDPGSGMKQEYVEDCQVCCRPWRLTVRYRHDGRAGVTAEPLA